MPGIGSRRGFSEWVCYTVFYMALVEIPLVISFADQCLLGIASYCKPCTCSNNIGGLS